MSLVILLLSAQLFGNQKIGTIDHLELDYDRAGIVGETVGLIVLANGNNGGIKLVGKSFDDDEEIAARIRKKLTEALEVEGVTALAVPLSPEEVVTIWHGYSQTKPASEPVNVLLANKARDLGVDNFLVVRCWVFMKITKDGLPDGGRSVNFRLSFYGGVTDVGGNPLCSGRAEAELSMTAYAPVTRTVPALVDKAAKRYAEVFSGRANDRRLRWEGTENPSKRKKKPTKAESTKGGP